MVRMVMVSSFVFLSLVSYDDGDQAVPPSWPTAIFGLSVHIYEATTSYPVTHLDFGVLEYKTVGAGHGAGL